MAVIEFKRGDTFTLQGQVKDSEGTPIDITGWSIRSHIRKGSELVIVLTVTFIDVLTGVYQLSATPEDTSLFPVGQLVCDIEYTTAAGQVMSTETFEITCTKDITI